MNLLETIRELKKYDRSVCELYEGIAISKIENLEKKLLFKLPNDFKLFLSVSNGADILCQDLYGIDKMVSGNDLYKRYVIEKDEMGNPIRDYYLPIYPDGMGNHNCLDLRSISADGEKCNVIFWQHDRLYSDNDQPDIDANSFTEYLESLLKEISETYNYDGTEK